MTDYLVISGLSGAGRSTAADTFEDQGWFVIDNLPPALIPKVAELASKPGSEAERVALVVWSSPYLDELLSAIEQLRADGDNIRTLFLEANDETLVRRYEESRRRHPMEAAGVVESIQQERARLESVKAQADFVIDTSELNVHQLRDRILSIFAEGDPQQMQVGLMSFGYKHGVPLDVDLVFDCRFLPNPHWVDGLRALTGLDEAVRDYVIAQPDTEEFLVRLTSLLELLLPAYVREGKAYLTIAVGCTGGRHRSVVMAEEIGDIITDLGYDPAVNHRDVER
ncbi:MAG: RNase adapter RapZ [Acidimicrobiales bacterium]